MTDAKRTTGRLHEVELSGVSAEALDRLDVCGHVGRINVDLPQMAWLWFVAQEIEDNEDTFPRGKWATLQHIEAQLRATAKETARAALAALEEVGKS